ncbi:unnamed protein product [Paramecium sonneborni]|uniref:Transmembrane protein n=1 Tax=Paramecium sonneborni TaxID=65129 RepID=A0A8S1PQ06_9CILI|nr:unnamed protein product [Paramecium sonneborni]
MRYQYHLILIHTLLLQIIVCEINQCLKIIMEPDEIFTTKKESILIVNSDEHDYENINLENYKIIQESQRIKKYQKEEIIYAQIIQINGAFQIFSKLFCQFSKSEYYFISCIKIEDSKQYENDNVIEQNTFQIDSNIKDDHTCEEFQFEQNSGFILFCFKDFYFKIYIINFETKTQLLEQVKIENSMYTLCKRKIFKKSDHNYIIAFIQCYNWGVFIYNNKEINIVLNEKIVNSNYSQQINFLENFEMCQNLLIALLTETSYYLFKIDYQNEFGLLFVTNDHLNSFILSQENCQIIYKIKWISSLNKTVIQNNKYRQEFEGTLLNFKLFLDILFVQTNNQLHVIFNKELKQVININSSKFYFGMQNLIYQIDQVANEIVFYRFSFPRCYIQPTKKYIHLIVSQSQAFNYPMACYEITYQATNAQLIQDYGLKNNCEKQFFFLFSKKQLNLINDYQINLLPLTSSNLKISILDKSPFNSFCRNLNDQVYEEQTLLYQGNDNQQSYSLFKTKNYIEIKSCKEKFQFKIQTQQYQVLQYRNSILLWQKDNRKLKQIKLQVIQPLIIEYKFKSEIINILQFQDIIIILTKNQDELKLFDLQTLSVVIIDQNIQNILHNLNQKYLLENQQYEQFQVFYFSKFNYQVIQLFQYLIIFINSEIIMIETDFIQIVFTKIIINSKCYILGIHLIKNQIIEQIFNGYQILTLKKINLDNYEIIRPLFYQIDNEYFAIATRNSSKTFIIVFVIQNRLLLKQIKTIEIGRVQFFFQDQYLFFYDQGDKIQKFNMRDFEISLEINSSWQNSLISHEQIFFQVIPIDTKADRINLEIKIQIYNECFQLFQKNNHVLLKYKKEKNFRININDYIFGPIDNIQIINNDNFSIKGPLLLSEQINNNDILDGIKLKSIYLGSVLQELENVIIFQTKNNSIVLFRQIQEHFYKKEEQLQNIISINDQSLLFLFLNNNFFEIRGVIYSINETAMQLIAQPIYEIKIKISPNSSYESMKTGNLIIIKDSFTLQLYQIIQSKIYQIQNLINITEILKIKGDNQLYISLIYQEGGQILTFQILSLDKSQFQLEGVAELSQQTIDFALKNYIQIKTNKYLNKDYKLNLLECTIDGENLQLTIFQSLRGMSIISEILIQRKNLEVQFKPIRILRNFEEENHMELQYFSNHHLILKSHSFIYFYDLKESDILDQIGRRSILQQYIYHQINTTHFIVFQYKKGGIFIGEIGYQITINDETQNNETFTLLAENQVSSISLQIFLQVSDEQSYNKTAFRILFFIFALILIIYYFIRRMQLKKKQINNQKHIFIYQNNSES